MCLGRLGFDGLDRRRTSGGVVVRDGVVDRRRDERSHVLVRNSRGLEDRRQRDAFPISHR